jgi:hypothetical protein
MKQQYSAAVAAIALLGATAPGWAGSDGVDATGGAVVAAGGGAVVAGEGTAVGVGGVGIARDGVSAAFGEDNLVAAAHLEEVTTIASPATVVAAGSGVSVLQFGAAGAAAIGPDATASTGNISNQTLGSLSGANMFVANSGIANQGDAVGISAAGSF